MAVNQMSHLRKSKISAAVATILGVSGPHAALAAGADPLISVNSKLQPVIVTATRYATNAQDVPITMQALTGRKLTKLNVQTLSDYVKYIPNVTIGGLGPGYFDVFMRGLSLGAPSFGDTAGSFFPNVALYLDNESTTMPDRSLDIYAVDLQRMRCSKARREPCSGRARRPVPSGSSPTSRNWTPCR